ncbi:hypothetical protein FGB62_224g06 [Gracilaria domingensis]|nr:hypothetical protein FGB62_224g06 [Gracilaria domingensis]
MMPTRVDLCGEGESRGLGLLRGKDGETGLASQADELSAEGSKDLEYQAIFGRADVVVTKVANGRHFGPNIAMQRRGRAVDFELWTRKWKLMIERMQAAWNVPAAVSVAAETTAADAFIVVIAIAFAKTVFAVARGNFRGGAEAQVGKRSAAGRVMDETA